MKPIAVNTHIDCSNNSKCSVRYILKATARSLESVLLEHFLLTGATAISGSKENAEFLLYAGMECGLMTTKKLFPDSYDLLQMPEIWIGDTAATTEMAPHQMGMTEVAGHKTIYMLSWTTNKLKN